MSLTVAGLPRFRFRVSTVHGLSGLINACWKDLDQDLLAIPIEPTGDARSTVLDGTAEALWSALGKYNRYRLKFAVEMTGIYDKRKNPDAKNLSVFHPAADEADISIGLGNFLFGELADADQPEPVEPSVTDDPDNDEVLNPKSKKKLADKKNGRTYSAQIKKTISRVEKFSKDLAELNTKLLSYGYLGVTSELIEESQTDERVRKILKEELRIYTYKILDHCDFYTNLANLLRAINVTHPVGGPPEHVFHVAFANGMIDVWKGLTGSLPPDENRKFLDFLQSAYAAVTNDEFEHWQGVFRTALRRKP